MKQSTASPFDTSNYYANGVENNLKTNYIPENDTDIDGGGCGIDLNNSPLATSTTEKDDLNSSLSIRSYHHHHHHHPQ
ncbi:unnamed protein product, partial [Rotaria socialis]